MPAPRPDYTDTQFMASVGGPFKIPGVRNRPVFFAGYQHAGDHAATAQSAVVPTLRQRTGDFSAGGEIRDPETGRPFPGNVIPAPRISPEATALLDQGIIKAQPEGAYTTVVTDALK